jgi:hypothetical protein
MILILLHMEKKTLKTYVRQKFIFYDGQPVVGPCGFKPRVPTHDVGFKPLSPLHQCGFCAMLTNINVADLSSLP